MDGVAMSFSKVSWVTSSRSSFVSPTWTAAILQTIPTIRWRKARAALERTDADNPVLARDSSSAFVNRWRGVALAADAIPASRVCIDAEITPLLFKIIAINPLILEEVVAELLDHSSPQKQPGTSVP